MFSARVYAAVRKGKGSKNSLRWGKKEAGKLNAEQWVYEPPCLVHKPGHQLLFSQFASRFNYAVSDSFLRVY